MELILFCILVVLLIWSGLWIPALWEVTTVFILEKSQRLYKTKEKSKGSCMIKYPQKSRKNS